MNLSYYRYDRCHPESQRQSSCLRTSLPQVLSHTNPTKEQVPPQVAQLLRAFLQREPRQAGGGPGEQRTPIPQSTLS